MAGRSDLDLYNVLLGFGWVRERVDLVKATLDPGFLLRARRALFPLPLVDRPPKPDADVFQPFRRRPLAGFEDRRIALIAGGGAGACVSLIGVRRAFEEAGIEPDLITSCSGGTIWGSMWAAGMSAQEMADFSLSWHLEDYLDVQWARVPRYAAAALKGFTGLAKGEAIERTFDERFGSLTARELEIPLTPIVYDMDRGIVDYFDRESQPDLTIGRLVRIAIALPVFIESVEVDGHLYVDGGIIDLLPAEPILRAGGFDHVFAVNFMLPPKLESEDITGWQDTRMGVLKASRQAEQGFQLEFAHRMRRALGDRLTVIDAADHRLLRGPAFYDIFIDRSRWPELIRAGYERTTRALDALRSDERVVHATAATNGGGDMEERRTTPGDMTATGVTAIRDYLDGSGVPYELIEHAPTMSAFAEASATKRPPERVAKTVVLQHGGGYVVVAVPASERLDLRKLRDLVGATRALRLATEKEMARDFPTIEVGAAPPFGPMLPRAEVIDRRLLEEDRILCAAGDHRHSVLVDPRDVVRITEATTADICED
jgi:NTE family protein